MPTDVFAPIPENSAKANSKFAIETRVNGPFIK
jgi:hypothetical protein